ncbi:hypothetical protein DL98DRAFT_536108 [Cadophora sp. DSE1049]|nr:hypothetical protein DL98DRAFT_536108 [Cadophora sp. DSE1049]
MIGSRSSEDEITTATQVDELSRPTHVPRVKTAYAKLPDKDQKALKAFAEARKAKRSSTIKATREAPDDTRETPRALDSNLAINTTHEAPDETRETLRALARVLNTKAIEGSNKSTETIREEPDETRETLRALARVLNSKSTMASERTLKHKYDGISNEHMEKDIADQRAQQSKYENILQSPEILTHKSEIEIKDIRGEVAAIDQDVKEMEAELARRKKEVNSSKKGKQDAVSGSGSGGFDDSGLGSSGLGDESGLDKKPKVTSTPTNESGQPPDEFNDSNVFSSTGIGNTSSGPSKDNEAKGLFVPNLPKQYQTHEDDSGEKFFSVRGSEAGDSDDWASQYPGLFTPKQADKAAGRRSDGVVTHWRKQGNANHVIVRYGPPDAEKYTHTTSSRAGKNFDKKYTPKFGPAFRYGDKKDEDGNHLRSFDDFKGFLGEAYQGDVEGLRPKETWTDRNGKKRVEKRTFPITDLYVLWFIGGEWRQAWETRSSIKHLWTSPEECDKDIYNSAKHHAAEHQKWLDTQDLSSTEDSDEESSEGGDEGDENSSSDGGDGDDDGDGSDVASETSNMEKTRSPHNTGKRNKDKGNDRKGTGNQKKGTKTNKNNTAADEDDDIKTMLRYQKRWCALRGIKPEKMTSKHEREFLRVWDSLETDA